MSESRILAVSRPAAVGSARITPTLVIGVLAAAGWLMAFVSEFLPGSDRFALAALLLLVTCLVGWLLTRVRPELARPFLVAVVTGMVFLAYGWLGVNDALPLLAVPAALATALIGFPATLLTALVETAVLTVFRLAAPAELPLGTFTVSVLAIWAIVATVFAIFEPVAEIEGWLLEYFQRAQAALEEARDRRANLEQALADLAHANRQLALANERTGAMRRLAEEAQKSKAAFVAKVSHEFRTPLNMIIGLIDLLVEAPDVYGEALPPTLFEDLKIVHRNCEHLSSMVNDVLDLSQAEAGRLVLHQERVDLAEIIDGALSVVRLLLDKKSLQVQVIVPGEMPKVYCDRTRIRQVILNLVSNAARYTDHGGVTVRAWVQHGKVVVSVADTGPGIPPEETERVFEPFSQVAGGLWRDRRGSGLGLSISKQFVEMHGGRIWLESQLGAGTTVSFDLPVSPPLAPSAGPARWISADWEWRERTSRSAEPMGPLKPRVVLCDESGHLYQLLAHYADTIELVDAGSLEEAARELAACPAHALLINVPRLEDLRPLLERARRIAPDVPVYGCAVPPPITRALEAGALDYLVRPVGRNALAWALTLPDHPVHRVLVVDDEADVRHLLTRMLLACDATLEVSAVAGGEEALAHMAENRPDLVLLDVIMPGLDGWGVLQRKGRAEELRAIPVIMITSQDPAAQPAMSDMLVVTIDRGLPVGKLLDCSLALSGILMQPGPA